MDEKGPTSERAKPLTEQCSHRLGSSCSWTLDHPLQSSSHTHVDARLPQFPVEDPTTTQRPSRAARQPRRGALQILHLDGHREQSPSRALPAVKKFRSIHKWKTMDASSRKSQQEANGVPVGGVVSSRKYISFRESARELPKPTTNNLKYDEVPETKQLC